MEQCSKGTLFTGWGRPTFAAICPESSGFRTQPPRRHCCPHITYDRLRCYEKSRGLREVGVTMTLVERNTETPNDAIAIVLAAGKSTRMKSVLPKVVHEI